MNTPTYSTKAPMNEMQDVTDTLVIEEAFDHSDIEHATNSCLAVMDELVSLDPLMFAEPTFDDWFCENTAELIESMFDDIFEDGGDCDKDSDVMSDLIEHCKQVFFSTMCMPRHTTDDEWKDWGSSSRSVADMTAHIDALRARPQPTQRTPAWYRARHDLLTASNAHLAFETPASRARLVAQKGVPFVPPPEDVEGGPMQIVNTSTTFHWGHKYEPLSVKIYETMFGTRVEDFGCITHEDHTFIGASPDGINVDPKSDRFGRLLEIKNVVSRVITGIPKKDYWIQMQMQLEVCDMEACDFLETKFVEYDTFAEFCADSPALACPSVSTTVDEKVKGTIVQFLGTDGAPVYEHAPLDLVSTQELETWEGQMMDKHSTLTFITFIYWKLDVMSCVVVPRNRLWFREAMGVLDQVWCDIGDARRTATIVQKDQKVISTHAPVKITTVPTAKLLLPTPFTKARAVAAVNAANAAKAAAFVEEEIQVVTVTKIPGPPSPPV